MIESDKLNTRLRLILAGDAPAGPVHVAEAVIELLRSDEGLDRDTRELLAQALVRGLNGNRVVERNVEGRVLPRLHVEGDKRQGKIDKAILDRLVWLDCAEAVEKLRMQGSTREAAMMIVCNQRPIGWSVLDKALKLHNKFRAEVADPSSALRVQANAQFRDGVEDTLDDELDDDELEALGIDLNFCIDQSDDHYYFARRLFAEREAESAVK